METDFFDLVAGVLQGDTLALYLIIICLDYVLRMLIDLIKVNSVTLKRTRWYLTETITDADYADYIVFLENTPAQAGSLQYILEQTAGGIGLHVNADKMKYICFNQGAISTG